MNSLRPNIYAFTLAACMVLLALPSCATGNVNIPQELSPAEIIQRAQEASDRNRYNVALQYYQALLERNPYNLSLVCTAEYEIAFIHFKQKKYPQAREQFYALLERYQAPGGDLLPQQFRILTTIVLERIDERENTRSLFSGLR